MTGVMGAEVAGAQNLGFCYYGQTVGDMDTSQYTDPH